MENKREIRVNEDVILKELSKNDAEIIFHTLTQQRTYFSEWLPFVENTRVITDTQAFIDAVLNDNPLNITCVIYYKNVFVGLIGLKDTDSINKKTEIGYWLSKEYQKKGIVTQSCKALIEYAFDVMKMNRITLKAATENKKSRAVAERLGFTCEGIEREGELHSRGYLDLAVYGLLSSERQNLSGKYIN